MDQKFPPIFPEKGRKIDFPPGRRAEGGGRFLPGAVKETVDFGLCLNIKSTSDHIHNDGRKAARAGSKRCYHRITYKDVVQTLMLMLFISIAVLLICVPLPNQRNNLPLCMMISV